MTTNQKLIEALNNAASHSVNPKFSLFKVSPRGEWTLIHTSSDAQTIVAEYLQLCLTNTKDGLEIRCDGIRVQLV